MGSQEVMDCPDCEGQGTGTRGFMDFICPKCEGTGEIWYDSEDDYAYMFPLTRDHT